MVSRDLLLVLRTFQRFHPAPASAGGTHRQDMWQNGVPAIADPGVIRYFQYETYYYHLVISYIAIVHSRYSFVDLPNFFKDGDCPVRKL